jgi:HisJ family histidinol phosphate phosphatase
MLKIDYHMHTTFSDGEATYKEVIDRAKELKLDCIAITDHFDPYDPNPRVSCLKEEDLLKFFMQIKEYAANAEQKVLCGIETCTDFNGNLRLSDKVMKASELIITSPHYIEHDKELIPGNYFDDSYWNSYKKKVLNMAAGQGDILGHAEAYLPYSKLLVPNTTTYEDRVALALNISNKYFDEEYIEELAKALKKSNKAYELHCATSTPREWVIEKLIKSGIKLSFGSDTHVLSKVGNISWAEQVLRKFNAESQQFIKYA